MASSFEWNFLRSHVVRAPATPKLDRSVAGVCSVACGLTMSKRANYATKYPSAAVLCRFKSSQANGGLLVSLFFAWIVPLFVSILRR